MSIFDATYQRMKRVTVQAVCLVMVTFIALGGAWVPSAQAVGSDEAAAVINERASNELDRTLGAGTSDQLEGTVDGAIGNVKRSIGQVGDNLDLDKAASQLDGAADQLKGKIKRDVGRAKSAAAEAGDDIEDTSEGIVESIKDLFD